jgi:hypothetical protein
MAAELRALTFGRECGEGPATGCSTSSKSRSLHWERLHDANRGYITLPRHYSLPEGVLNGFESLITRSTLAYHPWGAYSFPWR